MKDKLSAFWKSFVEKWKAIAKGTKIFIITALCVVIVAAIVLTIILNQKSYTAIYTGLDNVEAGQVVTAINDLGITDVVMGTDGSIREPAEYPGLSQIHLQFRYLEQRNRDVVHRYRKEGASGTTAPDSSDECDKYHQGH